MSCIQRSLQFNNDVRIFLFLPIPLMHPKKKQVYNGTQGKSSPIPPLPPPCVMKVEAVCAADHPLLQIIKCKTKLPLELGKQYAHPVQQHLIRVEHGAGAHLFAYVDSYTRILQHLPPNHDPRSPSSSGSNPGSYFELTLCLRVCKLDFAHSSSLENREIRCTTVASLADHVRKWNGLVNLHTSPLAANILSPLGGVYFGGGKQPPSDPLRNEVIQMVSSAVLLWGLCSLWYPWASCLEYYMHVIAPLGLWAMPNHFQIKRSHPPLAF